MTLRLSSLRSPRLARCGGAAAQDYPTKPVRIVVGFAAGGPTDVIARIVAQDMTASLGQSFIVENRPGANAIIATELVARSAPDGYTAAVLLAVAARERDPAPGQGQVRPVQGLRAGQQRGGAADGGRDQPGDRLNSMQELIARAKAKPGELTYGTPGHGRLDTPRGRDARER